MRILRGLLFGLCAAAEDMGDMPALFPVKNVRQMIPGGAFTKANKGAM